MPIEHEDLELLVAPWRELEPEGGGMEESAVIDRLDQEAQAAADLGDAGRIAAIGLVIAVGNWEELNDRRKPVLDKANELLDKYEPHPVQSRRFG